jgi:hypothetical protein
MKHECLCNCNYPGIGHFKSCPAYKPWHKDIWKLILMQQDELIINPEDFNEKDIPKKMHK